MSESLQKEEGNELNRVHKTCQWGDESHEEMMVDMLSVGEM